MIVLSSRTINITESRPGERGRVREVIRITEADTQDITPATTTFSILPTSTIKHQSTVRCWFAVRSLLTGGRICIRENDAEMGLLLEALLAIAMVHRFNTCVPSIYFASPDGFGYLLSL